MSMYHFLKRSVTDIRRRNVIWTADTNYRVELDNEIVRHLAENDELDALVASDQVRRPVLHFPNLPLISPLEKLKNAMDAGVAFVGYDEGPLLFRPTYRYDVGTDIYDTSEKMRIPAWTGTYSQTARRFTTFTSLSLRPHTISR